VLRRASVYARTATVLGCAGGCARQQRVMVWCFVWVWHVSQAQVGEQGASKGNAAWWHGVWVGCVRSSVWTRVVLPASTCLCVWALCVRALCVRALCVRALCACWYLAVASVSGCCSSALNVAVTLPRCVVGTPLMLCCGTLGCLLDIHQTEYICVCYAVVCVIVACLGPVLEPQGVKS
jgi:hypothetical protein